MTIARNGERPLIAHVLYRFDVGGLENGVVNVVNRLPAERFRHAIVALTDITDFRRRIVHDDVRFIALAKPPGHGFALYPRLYRLFRELEPSIVHSRNLAALEAAFPAWLARVPVRIHGEHGRDVGDLDGASTRHQRVRRLYRPFVDRYVAVSRDLESYLVRAVGIAPRRVTRICNGVDTVRFAPSGTGRTPIAGCPFDAREHWLVGTIGRLQAVKDQTTLAKAFAHAVATSAHGPRMRLVIAGDGPLRADVESVLRQAGVADRAWLAGERADVADILRGLDCFVLPSLAEGISNTILEAMASGLPVVATRVGGNTELVDDGVTGLLVPANDPAAMARAIDAYLSNAGLAAAHARAGRERAVKLFAIERMVGDYLDLYETVLEPLRTARGTVGDARRHAAHVR